MARQRTIIDIHVHIFNSINGRGQAGPTSPLPYGKIKMGENEISFMPPYSRDTAFPADAAAELMDRAGVSRAVLLQNPVIGMVNDEIADAIGRYPGKFAGTIQVDPLDPRAVEKIRHYAAKPRQNILKFEMSDGWGWSGIHPGLRLNDDCFAAIWDTASELGLQVILDPGRPNNAGYRVEDMDWLTTRYSNLTFIIEHLGAMNRENLHLMDRWRKLVSLGKKKNVYLGIASIGAGLRDEYPCPNAMELLREGVGLAGAEKLLWGSDIPGNLVHYTYKQMIDMFLNHADFLSEDDKDLIMGENALRVITGLKS